VSRIYRRLKRYKFYPLIFILLSLLLLYHVNYILLAYELSESEHVINDLLKEIGIALFIVGTITILLEFGDFTEYFLGKLTDIIIGDGFIDRIDDDKLGKTKEKIERKLYFKNKTDGEEFYRAIQNEVTTLLDDCYYNEYELSVDCFVEDNKFRKRSYRRIVIQNIKDTPVEEQLPLVYAMTKIEGVNDQDLVKINSIKIDNKDITSEIKLNCTPSDETYDVLLKSDYKVNVIKTCVIEMELETLTPLKDIHYRHKILRPCKNYHVEFKVHDSGYLVYGHGFGFIDSAKLTQRTIENGTKIRFNDWVLPANGTIFTIVKRDSVS
jgi:hypothetical protein